MSYRVVCEFADAQDELHVYQVGDEFPRLGAQVDESRIEALASENNMLHKPVIVLYEEQIQPDDNQPENQEPEQAQEEQPKKTKKQK